MFHLNQSLMLNLLIQTLLLSPPIHKFNFSHCDNYMPIILKQAMTKV